MNGVEVKQIYKQLDEIIPIKENIVTCQFGIKDLRNDFLDLKRDLQDNYIQREKFNNLEVLVHAKTNWDEHRQLDKDHKVTQEKTIELKEAEEELNQRLSKLEQSFNEFSKKTTEKMEVD